MEKSFILDNFNEYNSSDKANDIDSESTACLDKETQQTMNELAEKIINSNDENEKNNLLFYLASLAEQSINSGYCARCHNMDSLLTEKIIAETVLANFTGKYFGGTRKSLIYDPKKQDKQVKYVPWFRMTLRWDLIDEFEKKYKKNNYVVVSHKCNVCDEKYCTAACQYITYKDTTNSISISKSCDGCAKCLSYCPNGYLIRKSVNSTIQSLEELAEKHGDTTEISIEDTYFKGDEKLNSDNELDGALFEFVNFVVNLYSSQNSTSEEVEYFKMFFSCTLVNILKHDAEIDYKNDNNIPVIGKEKREKLYLKNVINYIFNNDTVVLKNCDMPFMHYIINNSPQTLTEITEFFLKNYGDLGIDTKGMPSDRRIDLPIAQLVKVGYWMMKTGRDKISSVKSSLTREEKAYENRIYYSLRSHISEEKQCTLDKIFK